MLPTPRSSTSPSIDDCPSFDTQWSDWPGRGRAPWRPGDTPPHQRQKRRAVFMPDDTEGHPTKKQKQSRNTLLPRSPDNLIDSTNWQFREPTPSSSRRSSPVRGALEELRNSKPKVEIDAHAPLPDDAWAIRQRLMSVVRKAYIPSVFRVSFTLSVPYILYSG